MSAYRSAEIDAAIAALSQARDRIDATIASLEAGRVEVEQAWDRLSTASAAVFDEPPVNLVGRAPAEVDDDELRDCKPEVAIREDQYEGWSAGGRTPAVVPAAPAATNDVVAKCPQCGRQSRSYGGGCPECGFNGHQVVVAVPAAISAERVEEILTDLNNNLDKRTVEETDGFIRELPEFVAITRRECGDIMEFSLRGGIVIAYNDDWMFERVSR